MSGFVDIVATPEFKELLRTITRDPRQRERSFSNVAASLSPSVGALFAPFFDIGYKEYEITLNPDTVSLMIKTKFDSTPEDEMRARFPYVYRWIKNHRQAYDYDKALGVYKKSDQAIIAQYAQTWIDRWNVAPFIPGISNASDIIHINPYIDNIGPQLTNVTTANVLWNYALAGRSGFGSFGRTYYGESGQPYHLVNTPQLVEEGVFEWFHRNFWTGDIVLRAMMGPIMYNPPTSDGEERGWPNPEVELSFHDYSPVNDFFSQRYYGKKLYRDFEGATEIPVYYTNPKGGEPNENGYKYAYKPNMPLYVTNLYDIEELSWFYGGLLNKFEQEVENEIVDILQEHMSNMTYEEYIKVENNGGLFFPNMTRRDFYGTPDNQKIGTFVKSREFRDIVKDTVYGMSVPRIVGNWVQPAYQGYGFIDIYNIRVPFPQGRTVRDDAIMNIDPKVIWMAMWRYFYNYPQEMAAKNPVMHRWLLNHDSLWRRSDRTEKTRFENTPYEAILSLINASPFVPSKDSRQQFFTNGPTNIVNNQYDIIATARRASPSSYASYFSDLYEWNPERTAASLIGKERTVDMQAITILYDSFWTGLPIYVFFAGRMLKKEGMEDEPDILDHVSRVIDYGRLAWNPSKDFLFQTPAYRLTGNNDVEELPSAWFYYPYGLNGDKPEDQYAYADGFLYKEYDADGEIQWIGQGLYQKFGSVIMDAEITSVIAKGYSSISYEEYTSPDFIDSIMTGTGRIITLDDWEGDDEGVEALKAKTSNTLQKVWTGQYVKGTGKTASDPIAINWDAVKAEVYRRVENRINSNDIGLDGSASGLLISRVRALAESAFPSNFGYSITDVRKISANQYSITYQNGEIQVVNAVPAQGGGGGESVSSDSLDLDFDATQRLTYGGSYSRIVPIKPRVFRANIPRVVNRDTVFKLPILFHSFMPVEVKYDMPSLHDAFVVGLADTELKATYGSFLWLYNPYDIIKQANFDEYVKVFNIISPRQELNADFGDVWDGLDPLLVHTNEPGAIGTKFISSDTRYQLWCSIRLARNLTQEELDYINNLELVDGAAKANLFSIMIVPIAMKDPYLYDSVDSSTTPLTRIVRSIKNLADARVTTVVEGEENNDGGVAF